MLLTTQKYPKISVKCIKDLIVWPEFVLQTILRYEFLTIFYGTTETIFPASNPRGHP